MKRMSCLWWIIIVISTGTSHINGFTVDIESRLRNELLANYSTSVRPSSVTLIELSFNLLSINFVDLKNEQFSISGWWSMKWNDSRLSWTGTTYPVPVIQVYETDIWTPALVVDNSVKDLSAIDESSIPIRVAENGRVTWNPPGILVTSCEMVVTYFPFDTQVCSVEITSFGYTIQELDISVHSGISTKYFSLNGEWDLLKTWNERSEFDEDGYTYAQVSFYFQLERHAVYYGLNTMLPVLLNSLLIPLVFFLPHDSGEKIGYGLTTLLAYVVILTLVTDGLPTTAKTQSLLGVYIAMVLMLSGLSVALAIHSLNLYHRAAGRRIPQWQQRLTRNVNIVIGRKGTCRKDRVQEMPAASTGAPSLQQLHREDKKSGIHDEGNAAVNSSGVRADVRSVTPSEEDGEMTWQEVAQVYDAFFFRVYFLVIFCSSLGFLFGIISDRV